MKKVDPFLAPTYPTKKNFIGILSVRLSVFYRYFIGTFIGILSVFLSVRFIGPLTVSHSTAESVRGVFVAAHGQSRNLGHAGGFRMPRERSPKNCSGRQLNLNIRISWRRAQALGPPLLRVTNLASSELGVAIFMDIAVRCLHLKPIRHTQHTPTGRTGSFAYMIATCPEKELGFNVPTGLEAALNPTVPLVERDVAKKPEREK